VPLQIISHQKNILINLLSALMKKNFSLVFCCDTAEKVSGIQGNEIIIGNHHIPISRNAREEALSKLLKGRFLKR
jgi:hypothetical protein